MLVRGEEHRAAIRTVLDAFGDDARHFVFVGGCVLGLYARREGAALRATKDVDCISTRTPWSHQLKALGDLCTRGVLSPDPEIQCRYRIKGTHVDVDVLSPEGRNVGGVNPFFQRACERAHAYDVGDGRKVNAVTPAYFLATKVAAFEARGPDALESRDLEDIVALAVEVDGLVRQVAEAGIAAEVAEWWRRAFRKYSLKADDLPDVVDGHLAAGERPHRNRILTAFWALIPNETGYCACIHGNPGSQTFAPMRSEPGTSRLAFKFQAPDFATDAVLNDYFAATFFPLRVVFDDERGKEHLSQDGFRNYVEARIFMSTVARMNEVEAYEAGFRGNRKVRVCKVRVLAKDGHVLDEREPQPE